jgi:hypothetical protein
LGFHNFLNAGTTALYSDIRRKTTPTVDEQQQVERDDRVSADHLVNDAAAKLAQYKNNGGREGGGLSAESTYTLQDETPSRWDVHDMTQSFDQKMVRCHTNPSKYVDI